MKSDDEGRFTAVARERSGILRKTALSLCGDWHLADDLTQKTLLKLYLAWPLRDVDAVDAWLLRCLVRTFIDETRRGWWRRERGSDAVPDGVSVDHVDTGLDPLLLGALAQLPTRQRACVTLRFLNDCSVEETARAIGCSAGTVRSQTSRGLGVIREHLTANHSLTGDQR